MASRRRDRILDDLRLGRHREAYVVSFICVVLAVLGIVADLPDQVLLSALLLGVTFLVFATTLEPAPTGLDAILRDRSAFGSLSTLIEGHSELLICAPTAANILTESGIVKQQLLSRGGSVRILVQDPNSAATAYTKAQLDDNNDFDAALRATVARLRTMATWGDCRHRFFEANPGFSMVAVGPRDADGEVVVEFHGYANDAIDQRMHIRIARDVSLRWHDYWVSCFDTLWEAAREPDASDASAEHSADERSR